MNTKSYIYCRFFIVVLIALIAHKLSAYDFEHEGIYYSLSGTGVMVTSGPTSSKYTGDIVVPSVVTHDGKNYSVVAIDGWAFYTSNITSIKLPNTITSIGRLSFYSCQKLTSIELPNSLLSIGSEAFSHSAINEITIPSSVSNIGEGAFAYCSSLTTIKVSSSNLKYKDIDGVLFSKDETILYCYPSGRTGMYSIPATTKEIGVSAFQSCHLSSIIIPNSVLVISKNSFHNCYNLTSIEIPSSVSSINEEAFYNCSNLEKISVDKDNMFYMDNDGVLFTKQMETLICFPNKKANEYIIPEGTVYLAKSAFLNSNIKEITIPSTVHGIGSTCFYMCSNLKIVKSNIIEPLGIGSLTFSNQKNATLYVPKGSKAAYQSAAIWKEFKEIVEYGSNDSNISFADATVKQLCVNNWDTNGDGELSYDEAAAVKDLGRVFSGKSITTFDELQYFTGLNTIGESAFVLCTNLTSISLPNSLASIGMSAFYDCSSLASISLPSSLTSIGQRSFENCSSLTYITIPASVESISYTSFLSCSGLNSIYVEAGNSIYDSRNNCNAIISSSDNCLLLGCRNTIIPNTVKIIGDAAFCDCSGLYSIEIPNGVTSIEDFAFAYCANLNSISIPSTMTNIEREAFQKCTNLTSIKVGMKTPGSISGYCFQNKGNASLYVPYGCKSAYEAVSSWNGFKEIVEYGAPTTYSLSITSSGKGWVTYSGTTIDNTTSSFSVTEGSSITLTFSSAYGNRLAMLKVDDVDVTSSVSNSQYTINNINSNTTVSVTFEHDYVEINGIYYILDQNNRTAEVTYRSLNPIGKSYSGSVNIPQAITYNGITYSVSSIGVGAFKDCWGVTSVTIPNSVTTIGESALSIIGITSITIPNSVKSIGKRAFSSCSDLKEVKSEITSPFAIETNVFDYINKDAVLQVPQGTKSQYQALSGWTANFKEIVEYGGTTTYSLSITSSGSGYVTYSGTTINGTTKSFTINEGTSATLTFTPNNGYRVGSLKVNNVDYTSYISSNKYTINNISKNTTVSVTFEAIPPTTYSLSVTSSGYGYVTYSSTTINGTTKSFTVNEGTSATLTFTPNSGYRVGSLKINNVDYTSSISNNKYTISNINKNTTVSVTFEAIPPTTYSLSITSSGYGYVTYSGTNINGTTKSFTVNEGTSATLTFTPNNGYRVGSLKINNVDYTSSISNNKYTISNITKNTTVSVTFVEELKNMVVDGVNYTIVSYDNKTVNVASGSYGNALTVPATFTYQGSTWRVVAIESGALTNLAAIIWNPLVAFAGSVTNPNFLLYVKAEQYASSNIKNVIVDGVAKSITLTEATSDNDFYCPREFTARQIRYTHQYSMTTGINESKGWETIALPFDVQTIYHETKGEILPFAKWDSKDSRRPFWLYEMTSSGWKEAQAIKAYTPYIISMPNNDKYYEASRLNGSVTFSATNAKVEPTTVSSVTYQGKTFTPNFTTKAASAGLYALNVKNQWASDTNGQNEGSVFVQNLRAIHPFEAYMTTTSSSRSSFGIFEDMTTGIRGITELMDMKKVMGVYNLKGQKIKIETDRKLPAGVYIINGQKVIVK